MSPCISYFFVMLFWADNMIVRAEAINKEVPAAEDPKDVDAGDVLAADIPPRSGNHFNLISLLVGMNVFHIHSMSLHEFI